MASLEEKIKVVQAIGNEICEGCDDCSDCGIEPKECGRVLRAVEFLDEYVSTLKD